MGIGFWPFVLTFQAYWAVQLCGWVAHWRGLDITNCNAKMGMEMNRSGVPGMRALIALAVFWTGLPAAAEPLTVRFLEAGHAPGKARIEQLAWLTGQWAGTGLGGQIEEGFSAPKAGAIVGYFRMTMEGKPGFYEFESVVETGETLVFHVVHFNPDMTTWEKKDETTQFKLVAVEGQTAYFSGLTLSREGDALNGAIAFKQKDGSRKIEEFRYSLMK